VRIWKAFTPLAVPMFCGLAALAEEPSGQDDRAPFSLAPDPETLADLPATGASPANESGFGTEGQAGLAKQGETPSEAAADQPPPRQWLIPGRAWEPKRPGWFHLNTLGGYLELEGRYEQQRYRRRTAQPYTDFFRREPREIRQRNTEWSFRELLGVELDGDIYHPNVFEFTGRFALGFEQVHFRETLFGYSDEDYDSGILANFDLRGRAFSGGALNAEVYARRAQNRIPRRFIPSLDEDRTLYGVNFALRSDIIPMRLTIEREKINLDGDAERFDEEDTDEVRISYGADINFTEHNVLHMSYDYNRLEEDISGSIAHFDTRRHEWTLEHEFDFGPQHQHSLDTTLRLQQEDGDLARDLFEFTPRLTLKHSDSLTTYWTYQLAKEEYDLIGVQTNRGDFTLVHQLYESLTSTVNVFGQHQDFDDGQLTNLYGAGFREAYTKKNRWGTFRAELGYQWDQLKESEGDQTFIRRQESGTFRDPLPIYLSEDNVVVPTVVVTNTQRTRRFIPFRDYIVTRIGSRAAIHRVASGNIADGDSVLVTYDFRRINRSRIETQRLDARLEQRFDGGLRPYYEFNFRRQHVRQPREFIDFYFPDDLERHRIGIDYTKDRWFAGIEYEHEDRSIDPFDALHLNGRWTFFRDNRITANLTGRFSHFNFTDNKDFRNLTYDDRKVQLLDIGADAQFDISPKLSGNAAAYYRWENDSIEGVIHGVDLDGSLVYRIGRTQVELTAEYNLLTIEGSPDDGFGLWVRLRRDLGSWIR